MGIRRKRREGPRVRRRVDLRKSLFILPNLVTLSSIFCGFNAMRVVATDNPSPSDFYKAAIYLMYAMLFDLLDGRIARLTRTESAFGLQLDSLADVISFGATPSLLMYKWMLWRLPGGEYIAFLFMACGAARLARFNVMSSASNGVPLKPSNYTVGLPIPPASGILISLLLADYAVNGALSVEKNAVAAAVVTIVVSLLMVSTVRFRAFKDLRLSPAMGALVAFAIGSSFVVWNYTKPQFVLLWLLGIYVLIGLFETTRSFFQPGPPQPPSPPPLSVPPAPYVEGKPPAAKPEPAP